MDLGWQELLIVLLIALLVFGGSKLAGLGKASGKAIREFKEETQGLNAKKNAQGQADAQASQPAVPPTVVTPNTAQPQSGQSAQGQPGGQVVNGEVVDPPQNS